MFYVHLKTIYTTQTRAVIQPCLILLQGLLNVHCINYAKLNIIARIKNLSVGGVKIVNFKASIRLFYQVLEAYETYYSYTSTPNIKGHTCIYR